MVDETEKQSAVDVVEQLEEDHIDLQVVRWAAGEHLPSSTQKKWIQRLQQDRGDGFYRDIIFALTGCRYSGSEAHKTWKEIIAHREVLTQVLGRNPGVVMAALDWLTNVSAEKSKEFSLIESGKLENILERAVLDGLTNFYDHDTLILLIEKELERARRHSEMVSLLMLDIDNFKQVNDEFGHQKGDEVLTRMADIIRETIRVIDIAGRYGGEEFSIILPETNITEAIRSAQRLRKRIEASFSQDQSGLTVSIGVACFPVDGSSVDALVKKADEALYMAKSIGKNCVVCNRDMEPG